MRYFPKAPQYNICDDAFGLEKLGGFHDEYESRRGD
jgi:hypothetical protein